MRVMIVDDHPVFREGLKAIVGQADGFEVVAECGDGRDAIQCAREHGPDVMLMDISVPLKNGIQVIREVRESLPGTRFLVISMHSESDYIVEAFRAGATGYIIKSSASSQLLEALSSVSRGSMYLDTALSGEVLQRLVNLSDGGEESRDGLAQLTSREKQVMHAVIDGKTTKQIAEELFISPKTVENHRANMMRKLGFSSPVELLRYAARTGLIDMDAWTG